MCLFLTMGHKGSLQNQFNVSLRIMVITELIGLVRPSMLIVLWLQHQGMTYISEWSNSMQIGPHYHEQCFHIETITAMHSTITLSYQQVRNQIMCMHVRTGSQLGVYFTHMCPCAHMHTYHHHTCLFNYLIFLYCIVYYYYANRLERWFLRSTYSLGCFKVKNQL